MPTYEYHCKTCGHSFEVFQGISDPVWKKCRKENCKKGMGQGFVERKIGSGSGIIFRGSGFYETDYKRKSEKKS